MPQTPLEVGDVVLQIFKGDSPPICHTNYLGVVVDVFKGNYLIMFLSSCRMNESLKREELLDLQINISTVFPKPKSCHESRGRILDAYRADILVSLIRRVFDYENRIRRSLDSGCKPEEESHG